jgi:hypothetical protein
MAVKKSTRLLARDLKKMYDDFPASRKKGLAPKMTRATALELAQRLETACDKVVKEVTV